MSIRRIVAVHEGRHPSPNVIRAGVMLAERFDALLVCVHVIEPVDGPRYAGGLTLDQVMREGEQRAEGAANGTRLALEALAVKHGVRTEWRRVRGFPLDEAIVQARYADLTLVAQTDRAAHGSSFPLQPDDLLFAVGGPLIVVPREGEFGSLGRRVMVAWNESREAECAVKSALPILKAAEMVEIVLVDPHNAEAGLALHGDLPGAYIASYLAGHGIHPDVFVEHSGHGSIGRRLMERAAALETDLVVSGAFGYSRLRESLMGGVTQFFLDRASIPILMAR